MYFDRTKSPETLSKRQYGIKRSGKITILLDKNGKALLCEDSILNGFLFMVVVCGCVLYLLMMVLQLASGRCLCNVYSL